MDQIACGFFGPNIECVADSLRIGMDQFDVVFFLISRHIICNDLQGSIGRIGVVDNVFDVPVGLLFNAFQGAAQEFFAVIGTGNNTNFGIKLVSHIAV